MNTQNLNNTLNVSNYKEIKFETDNDTGFCPLEGIQEKSLLSTVFFSKDNVILLKKLLKYNVWLKSNKQYNICNQSNIELIVIMRAIYLQNSKNIQCKIKEQILELNNKVLDYSINIIINNIKQQQEYIKTMNNPRYILDRGVAITNRGDKLAEVKKFI